MFARLLRRWCRQIRQRVVSASRPCAISPTMASAMAAARLRAAGEVDVVVDVGPRERAHRRRRQRLQAPPRAGEDFDLGLGRERDPAAVRQHQRHRQVAPAVTVGDDLLQWSRHDRVRLGRAYRGPVSVARSGAGGHRGFAADGAEFEACQGAATIGPLASSALTLLRPSRRRLRRARIHRTAVSRCPRAVRHGRGDHLRARPARPVRRLHARTRSARSRSTRRSWCGASTAARRASPHSRMPSVTRSTCSRTTRPISRAGSRVRTPTGSRASITRLGARRRAADRRVRRVVRVPPPRAASGRRSRSIHRHVSDLRARNKGAGLVFHHGRFGTTHPAG